MTQITFEQALDLAWQHYETGRLQEAESICRQILQLNSNHPEALQVLGVIAHAVKRFDLALQLLTQSIALLPNEGKFHHNIAETLSAMGRYDEAIAAYRRAAELGNYALSWSALGNVLLHVGRGRDALEAHRRAVELGPQMAKLHTNFGVALQAHGRISEAIAAYRESIRLDPRLHGAHSNLLYAMHYTNDASPQEVFEAHRNWSRERIADIAPARDHPNDRSPDRKLRIGFVSADLINHPVGRFLLPLFSYRDASKFEFICFSCATKEDELSAQLKQFAQGWHVMNHLNEEQLAQLVAANTIDILVDLAGHTSGNCLRTFARKPAPVQVSWLGYPNTTGVEAIDYRITDAIADPPGESDALYTERLVRLPGCFLCFAPPADAPNIAREPGGITFGSFNYLPKISPEIAAIWRSVLDAVPSAKLVIKSRHISDAPTRDDAAKHFASLGLPVDRVTILLRERNPRAHLEVYNKIDIALDTFPYHGTTTTCEALWMGAPVVTLAGNTHVSRVGASLLTACGLADLIAHSADEYIAIASNLANDTNRLETFRTTARDKMLSSPLMGAATFANNFTDALRTMWRTWCSHA